MQKEALKIGVLALQGGFASHLKSLEALNCPHLAVRYKEDFKECSGLIIPGGESTTLSFLIDNQNLKNCILEFAKTKPLFGTCAGLIIMAKLGLLDVAILRNAYGRQTQSFSTALTMDSGEPCEGVFIRAPKIKAILSPQVKVLATFQGEAVMIKQGHLIGSTFHPELTSNTNIHRYFWQLCKEKQFNQQP